MKKNLLVALGVASVVTLTGCAGFQLPGLNLDPNSTPSATPTAVENAPLSGAPVPVGSLDHPVLMAKIDNSPEARPQVGLNDADIVFEELVEGGLSRYLAVWHSVIPAEIGPVRSIRPMDPDIALPFGGVITYSGGQQRFVQMMIDTGLKNVIDGQSGTEEFTYRSDTMIAPHDVIVRAATLIDSLADIAPPPPAFEFAGDGAIPTALAEGTAAGRLITSFSGYNSPSWVFDAESGMYGRLQAGGETDVDENQQQLTARNVVAQMVEESSEYGYVPHALVVGEGVAWISTGGKTVEATWTKTAPDAMTVFTLANGDIVNLAPGRTWIELVPTTSGYFEAKRR
ncbi:unannotated protein [freshwater metagenome]|uniref:Unannotated protein n=1 Tax=freshwater metagenome TaxID=449393 RepID=A0A6J6IT71_9ZZZZ|nr:DUF3048 domain-containing protein [Actinomycetota bacterium]